MKKVIPILMLLLLPLLGSAGDHNTNFLLGHLEKTSNLFTTEIAGLSEAQWRFKPGPDKWSIAECAEHIVLTEAFLRGAITDKVLASPAATPEQLANVKGGDEKVMGMIVDRSFKAQAPEPVKPIDVKGSPADLKSDFVGTRGKTVALVRSDAGALRTHVAESPIGDLDGYQWTLFISGHTERHVMQMREVKSHPDFPK
jgi:DinB family protein